MYKNKKTIYFTLPEQVRKEQEALDKMWDRFVMPKAPVEQSAAATLMKKSDTTEEG